MLPSLSQVTSVGRLKTHGRRGRRAFELAAFLDEALEPVERFLLAAERHRDAAVGTELDDHVRAFVGHPDVVVLVDTNRVREAGGVVVRAPLLHELQVLDRTRRASRRGAALHRARATGAAEHEQVTLRVLGDAHRFADGLAGDGQAQHFFGDFQLRRGFLELGLLGLLLGRAGETAAGGWRGRCLRRGAGPPSLF